MLLVTGITGHTGNYFLQELINHKFEEPIRCLVRDTSDTSNLDNSALKIEKIYGDLNSENSLREAMNGVDRIMHIFNIHHSPLVVKVAIESNVKHAVLVHTTGIYSNYKHASQRYKDIEERVLEMTSIPNCPTKITILRPSMIYGDLCDNNMSKFIKMIDRFRIVPIINGGLSLIQPVNARDLGKAYYTVLLSPEKTMGKTYDLPGDKPIKIIDAFTMISTNLKKKTIFVSIPLEVGVFLAKLVKIFSFGKMDYIEKMQRMAENRCYSYLNAKSDFEYNPISFAEGILIEVNQYLQRNMTRK